MKEIETLKRKQIIYFIFLILMILTYVFNIEITYNLALILYWTIYLGELLILKKIYKKELVLFLAAIIIDFILPDSVRHINLGILLAICAVILIIQEEIKENTKYKWYKVISIIIIIAMLIGMNFYISKDRLIKDRGLEKCIEEELEENGYVGEITISKLEGIRRLYIWSNEVYNLEGIEHLKNLKKLDIRIKNVKSLEEIGTLQELKHLSVASGRLEDILSIKGLENLEELEINYMKMKNTTTIDNFPHLKHLSIQGIDMKDLGLVTNLESLEALDISYGKIETMDGIEYLRNLKKLDLYHAEINDIKEIRKAESLEEVNLTASIVKNMETLKELAHIKRINIKKEDFLFKP